MNISVSDPSEYLGRSLESASTTFMVDARGSNNVVRFRSPVYARTSLLALQGAQDSYRLLSNCDPDELAWEVKVQ